MSRHGTLLALGFAALAAGCASSGAVPQPFPLPGGVRPPQTAAGGSSGSPETTTPDPSRPAVGGYAIAGTALALRGAPYRNGGADPSGFDCSGLVWYVFGQHGISVPRTVGEQFHNGIDVAADTLEAGDLVFFSTEAPGASHVGMLIGGDEFVHAPSARGAVRVERITSPYWAARFVGARRVR
jgi:cell wall-associated NlpC family hydrolase